MARASSMTRITPKSSLRIASCAIARPRKTAALALKQRIKGAILTEHPKERLAVTHRFLEIVDRAHGRAIGLDDEISPREPGLRGLGSLCDSLDKKTHTALESIALAKGIGRRAEPHPEIRRLATLIGAARGGRVTPIGTLGRHKLDRALSSIAEDADAGFGTHTLLENGANHTSTIAHALSIDRDDHIADAEARLVGRAPRDDFGDERTAAIVSHLELLGERRCELLKHNPDEGTPDRPVGTDPTVDPLDPSRVGA